MKKTIMILGVLFLITGISANAQRLDLARSIVCKSYGHLPVSVQLQGGSKDPGDLFFGNAAFGYKSAQFSSSMCKANATEVECIGQWAWSPSHRIARLRIKAEQDGTYKGYLLMPNQSITVMGCLPSEDSLN